jgi:hypothetical protein
VAKTKVLRIRGMLASACEDEVESGEYQEDRDPDH